MPETLKEIEARHAREVRELKDNCEHNLDAPWVLDIPGDTHDVSFIINCERICDKCGVCIDSAIYGFVKGNDTVTVNHYGSVKTTLPIDERKSSYGRIVLTK